MTDVLREAFEHHRAGRLDLAAQGYRRTLQLDPLNSDAHNLLAVAAVQAGDHAQARRSIRAAVALSPQAAPILRTLLTVTRSEEGRQRRIWPGRIRAAAWDSETLAAVADGFAADARPDQARQSLRRAAVQDPSVVAIRIALLSLALKDRDKASGIEIGRVLALDPLHAGGLVTWAEMAASDLVTPKSGLGIVRLWERGARTPELAVATILALVHLDRRKDAEPVLDALVGSLGNHVIVAETFANMAAIDLRRERAVDARINAVKAATLEPAMLAALAHLAEQYRQLRRKSESVTWARRAVLLAPDNVDALAGLGACGASAEDRVVFRAAYRRALALAPAHRTILSDFANASSIANDLVTGATLARRGLALAPDDPGAQLAAAVPLLTLGDLGRGLRLFESRLRLSGMSSGVEFFDRMPRWSGEDLSGRSLHVWMDQGIGDQFFYSAFLPWIPRSAGRVRLSVERRLKDLYVRSFPWIDVQDFASGVPEPSDFQISITSLALVFRQRLAEWIDRRARGQEVAAPQVLKADPAKVARHASKLREFGPGPRIAVSWRGGNLNVANCPHYMPAEDALRIFRDQNVTVVDVQYGSTAEERAELGRALPRFYHPVDLDLRNDLDEVAALLASCDLLITAHTAVMYLAASQGLPVWSFQLGTSYTVFGLEDRALFPNVRHFNRAFGAPWSSVADRLAGEVARFSSAREWTQ